MVNVEHPGLDEGLRLSLAQENLVSDGNVPCLPKPILAKATSLGPSLGIDRLFDVIMAIIFELGKVDDDRDAEAHVRLSKYGYKERWHRRGPFPLLISHVSRRWRAIAHQFPMLWTRIVLSREHNDLAFLFLQRSRHCLIDIAIYLGMNDTIEPHPWLSHVDRCRSLCIKSHHGSADKAAETLHLFRDVSAPQLQSLIINIKYHALFSDENEYVNPPGVIFTGGAPILTNIKIHGIGLDQCMPPLGAAVRLSLDSWRDENRVLGTSDYTHTMKALKRIPCLTHLTLRERALGDPQSQSRISVTLQNLVSLTVEAPDGILEADTYFKNLFSSLVLPNLEHMTLKHIHHYDLDDLITTTHVTRAHCPTHLRVKSISLHDTMVEVWNIHALGALWPDVEHLSISFGMAADGVSLLEFLEEAEVGEDKACTLWPLLTHVSITSDARNEAEQLKELERSLRAFLLSRKALGLPLQSITVPVSSSADALWYAEHEIDLSYA